MHIVAVMHYLLTNHARQRMSERSISISEVEFTLSNFFLSIPGDGGGTGLYALMPEGDVVIVWVANPLPLQEPLTIKSVARRVK